MPTPIPEIDRATRRSLAAGLFNRTWELLELTDRTPAQDDELVHTAHASRYHWGEVADQPARLARGEWLCSRVYAVLGRPEPARWHAARCLALLDECASRPDSGGAEDWDRAAAFEALARAEATAGNRPAALAWKALGLAECARITDEDDRRPIENDLDSIGA